MALIVIATLYFSRENSGGEKMQQEGNVLITADEVQKAMTNQEVSVEMRADSTDSVAAADVVKNSDDADDAIAEITEALPYPKKSGMRLIKDRAKGASQMERWPRAGAFTGDRMVDDNF